MTQQIWFEISDGGAGDVSQSSRWEKVSGWSWASPLSIHCWKRARLTSDMRSRLEKRIFVVADQGIDLFTRERVEIDLADRRHRVNGCGRRGHGRGRGSWRVAAHMRQH